jgi:predicted RNase H-like HicB family nuclease
MGAPTQESHHRLVNACSENLARMLWRALFGYAMRNEFTAIIEKDDPWFVAYSPEVPGANGQGLSKEEALASLAQAIELILEDRRDDARRGLPPDAIQETVVVG